MTWVIGGSSIFGAGVMISDVRVTLCTGEQVDLLQKSYCVGNFILAGFAGSVRIGFSLLDSLSQMLWLPEEQRATFAWEPPFVAETWAPEARRVFMNAPANERKLNAHVLLVGVSPSEHLGAPQFRRVFVIRMTAPEFRPGYMKRGLTACSIGTGAPIAEYKRAVRQLVNIRSGLIQAEMGGFGRWGWSLAHALSHTIERERDTGISRHLLAHSIRLGESVVFDTDRTEYPAAGGAPVSVRMPKLATSYPTFEDMLRARGASSAAAVC